MTPPRKPRPDSFDPTDIQDEFTGPIVLGDIMVRLGRTETQVNKILPVLGQVSEAINGMSVVLADIKTDLSSLRGRQDTLEEDQKAKIQKALDQATQVEIDRKKEKQDRRNSALKYLVGAIITVGLGALAAHFGWK